MAAQTPEERDAYLAYLNEDLKNLKPFPAAKLKRRKRNYYAAPAYCPRTGPNTTAKVIRSKDPDK